MISLLGVFVHTQHGSALTCMLCWLSFLFVLGFFGMFIFCHPSLHGLTLQVQQISLFSLRFAVQVGSCSDVQQKRNELLHTVTKFGMSWLANERHKHKQQIGGRTPV